MDWSKLNKYLRIAKNSLVIFFSVKKSPYFFYTQSNRHLVWAGSNQLTGDENLYLLQ